MKKKIFFAALIQLLFFGTMAQTKDLTGTVTNEKNEPIAGAVVKVKGNAQTATTDDNGGFQLKGIPDTTTLIITATSYQEMEIATGDKTTISITLIKSAGRLYLVTNPIDNRELMVHNSKKYGLPDIMEKAKWLTPGVRFTLNAG